MADFVVVAELSELEWSTPAAPWLGHDMRLIASHLKDYLDQGAASSLHLASGAAIRSLEELSEHVLVRDGTADTWAAKYLYPGILREVGNQRVDLGMTDLGANAALPAIHKRAVEEGVCRVPISRTFWRDHIRGPIDRITR